MNGIAIPNSFKFKVGDILPEHHEVDKNYDSPTFRTTNGQSWCLRVKVDKADYLACYLRPKMPILEPARSTLFILNGVKHEFTFEKEEGYGTSKFLAVQESLRRSIINLDIEMFDSIFNSIDSYRAHRNSPLYNNESVSDVAFEVDGQTLYANSGLLVQYSRYFKALLSSQFKESTFNKKSPISLASVTRYGVEKCFQWIYTGVIINSNDDSDGQLEDFDIDRAIEIYQAADMFLLDDLLSILPSYMTTRIAILPQNFGNAFMFAHQRELSNLLSKSTQVWLDEMKKKEEEEEDVKINRATAILVMEAGELEENADVEINRAATNLDLEVGLEEEKDDKTVDDNSPRKQSALIREYMSTLSLEDHNKILRLLTTTRST
ncbi:hypothetical protein HDV05_001844 [Chytridiales sp. JEL 0842]|nr:hypothetical protein HDV05_001844 [Chytridiales sp. JEL 0842]